MENRPTVARLSFPTEKGLQSPVLIDLDQLEALDEIIDKYAGKLRKDRDEQIDKATDAEIYERVVAGRLKQEEVETRRGTCKRNRHGPEKIEEGSNVRHDLSFARKAD